MNNVKTTRIELIKTRSRVRIAAKGLSLLKMKRSSLILEFFNLAREIELLRANIIDYVVMAMDSTKIAEAKDGRITLERIASEQKEEKIGIEVRNVMGVKIPNLSIEKSNAYNKEYNVISVPASISDVRKNYNALLKLLIETAEKENSLRKLLYEIEKLNRRSNAIENVTIPKMEEKMKYIKQRLDDMERDQIVSLKSIKKKISVGK
ncbi:V-type ATP synthase subunit D [Candidatus Marsarchaeota archaeon]|jgi:V/A-type H+-transporting ATPase subunit D|nr:V-type ATP synthase subunit D [Candidatus Marsarchaeota archaeon]